MNYVPYHTHTDYSVLDSCTQYTEYIEEAKKNGMTAIAFSEHGKISGWFKKMQACKKAGIKYIHAVECYLTETLAEKKRDNYHTVLIAKNKAGFQELNEILYTSFDKDHFYYNNRISFDEFLSLSDNIITTSACLAGPLNKLSKSHPYYDRLVRRYDYLEIQPHGDDEQRQYNIDLACLSSEYNKPLIAGTDTHSLNQYKAECRDILLTYKGQSYGNEDHFDLTFKTYDELVEAFKKQDSVPENIYLKAIDNTNKMADMIEDYEIDCSIKYPILYGYHENDHGELIKLIDRKFQEKIDKKAIPQEQIEPFKKAIQEEMSVFTKTNMDGFMLSMAELLNWMHDNGIVTGPSRGSVGGSRLAYITDIIDLNPETWHTVFSRFANEDRVEVGDIDIDCIESDRPKIFDYIINRFGKKFCARVSSFGTMAGLGAIDEIGGALRKKWDIANGYDSKDKNYDKVSELNPYSLKKVASLKKEYSYELDVIKKECGDDADLYNEKFEKVIDYLIEKYPAIFKYYRGMVGTKVSQSVHPAGMVISPVELIKNYGVFDKDGYNCLFLDMDECHDVGLVKYDFLCLSNVKIIKETCEMVGIPYPKTHEIDWNDKNVWKDMLTAPAGIFQMESDFAFQLMCKMKPTNIYEMSMITAAIRPAGSSYRNDLMARKVHDNGSNVVNELLKDNLGYLIYQEDVIKFLQDICGFTGSEADTMRRAIAKKKMELIEPQLPKVIEGYCAKSDKPYEEAKQEALSFIKIMQDASRYMFGYNHSIAYCLVGYICAYLRYYHPVEFITALLNNSKNQSDINKFTELASVYGISITSPKYGISKAYYSCNAKDKIITKGVASIKNLSEAVANELYAIHQENDPSHFVELLMLTKTTNKSQLEILIKTDFFSKFGNCKELMAVFRMFDMFDGGKIKSISKDKIKDENVAKIIGSHTNFGLDKNGRPSASYIFRSNESTKECMIELEEYIKNLHLQDLPTLTKIQNYIEYLGYIPATGNPEDRKTLVVLEIFPLVSKNGNIWKYRVNTQSLGSGKVARLSLDKSIFTGFPLKENDIIRAEVKKDEKGYWNLINYQKV